MWQKIQDLPEKGNKSNAFDIVNIPCIINDTLM